jgi:hypothetical protein
MIRTVMGGPTTSHHVLYRLPIFLPQSNSSHPTLCWNFEQSMGAKNRVGTGLWYRTAGLHRLAESIPWNRFLVSLKV